MQGCKGKRGTTERVRAWGWRLLAAALLAACGGGGGGGGGPAQDLSSRHYLPAAVGDRWIYTDNQIGSGPMRVKVVGTTAVGSQTGAVVRSEDGSEVVIVEDASGILQLPTARSDSLTAAIGPLQLMRYPLAIGDSFVNIDKAIGAPVDFDGDGIGDNTSVRGGVQVMELSTLATAVGPLTDCLHLRSTRVYTIQLSSVRRSFEMTETIDDWLAPGIGLVQSRQTLTAGTDSSTVIVSIAAYGVGSLRSEYRAPTASATFLDGGGALGPSTTVAIDFDEDMDPDSLAAGLAVTDAQGRAVAGTLTPSARSLRFTPTLGWATGDFTARLTGATDVVGNPAPAATWNFAIDATAPSVVGTQPLEGAVDVPLASAIELIFSEAVLASSVNDQTVRVEYDGYSLTMVSYQVDGNKVTLTPVDGLMRGKPYHVAIRGVTDTAGNPISATVLRFTTDPGRFGTPTKLPSPLEDMSIGSAAAAIGDINSDGLPDLVANTLRFVDGITGWESQLAVYLQQGGALPGVPTLVPLQAAAQITGIAIADVDQDGRNDVVVSEGERGVEIFRQGADGRLLAGQALATGTIARMRVVDMNGDGRPDIVGYGNNVVSVWLNLPGGWSRSDAVTVTDYMAANDLSVGDLNGDGRPDVVFVGALMPGSASAGVLRQGSDGRLGAPEWLRFEYNGAASFSFVADADGDGRADIGLSFSGGIVLARQQADGTLAPLTAIDSTVYPGTPMVADLNGDSRTDLLRFDGTLRVRLGQPGGGWAEAADYTGSFFGSLPPSAAMAVGDLNSDGRPDVVAGGYLFVQRPVPLMSQSIGSVRTVKPTRSPTQWLRSVLQSEVLR